MCAFLIYSNRNASLWENSKCKSSMEVTNYYRPSCCISCGFSMVFRSGLCCWESVHRESVDLHLLSAVSIETELRSTVGSYQWLPALWCSNTPCTKLLVQYNPFAAKATACRNLFPNIRKAANLAFQRLFSKKCRRTTDNSGISPINCPIFR